MRTLYTISRNVSKSQNHVFSRQTKVPRKYVFY